MNLNGNAWAVYNPVHMYSIYDFTCTYSYATLADTDLFVAISYIDASFQDEAVGAI